MLHPHSARAFSLVELSIVLVILGLLAGGIMVGQNMIRGAELKGVISDISTYQSAYTNFRDKYQSYPGDMPDATNNWGIRAGATGNDTTCRDTIGSYTGTCNGNGDNRIDESGGSNPATVFERWLAWQHLSLAGMIEGKFTGASNDAGPFTRAPGINGPTWSLGSSVFSDIVFLVGPVSGSPHYFDGPYNNNTLWIGQNIATPDELWSIDSKIDNGLPGTGSVVTLKASSTWGTGCATSDAVSAEYNVSSSNKTCTILYFFR